MNKAIIAVVVILLLLGGRWFLMRGQPTQPVTTTNEVMEKSAGAPSTTGIMVGEEVAVTISGFAFSPQELTVKKGATVKWTNQDSVSHTVTSDTGSELNSDLFGKGETFSHTFNTVGTYAYHCVPHPNMKGTVVVEE